jgi:hypothetical protein
MLIATRSIAYRCGSSTTDGLDGELCDCVGWIYVGRKFAGDDDGGHLRSFDQLMGGRYRAIRHDTFAWGSSEYGNRVRFASPS